jgi:hypothetical protein
MIKRIEPHSFHIPVMGIAYTIDTPVKIAKYGINSVISIIDNYLMEQMRSYYCGAYNLPYEPITHHDADHRANQTRAYLDLVGDLVDLEFNILKNSSFEPGSDITKYFETLPENSPLKQEYLEMLQSSGTEGLEKQDLLRSRMVPGEIGVNIMTKLDRVNYTSDGEPLPSEFNDAHSALRGFALSKISGALILSAGMNPRLYSYIAAFEDFFPDANGYIKKRVVLKVSDYRSAIIQGKFLAKKGIWVSEYRVESGLNCGGHAFASEGFLLGPILNEFKENRETLVQSLFEVYAKSLADEGKTVPKTAPGLSITVQGGVGTHREHQFLLDYYNIDSVGWGSPFMLVPEAVSIDKETIELLCNAQEEDYYLSEVSPLGVSFNTVRGSSADVERLARIDDGNPGAPCIKKFLSFNTEYTDRPICTASKEFQKMKLDEIELSGMAEDEKEIKIAQVLDKICLCVGLANASLLQHKLKLFKGATGVALCPGPNMAYFNRVVSLREMVDHIYGRSNILKRSERPHMFIKELSLYMNFLKKKVEEVSRDYDESKNKYVQNFRKNLNEGIVYYKDLFANIKQHLDEIPGNIILQLNQVELELNALNVKSQTNSHQVR